MKAAALAAASKTCCLMRAASSPSLVAEEDDITRAGPGAIVSPNLPETPKVLAASCIAFSRFAAAAAAAAAAAVEGAKGFAAAATCGGAELQCGGMGSSLFLEEDDMCAAEVAVAGLLARIFCSAIR